MGPFELMRGTTTSDREHTDAGGSSDTVRIGTLDTCDVAGELVDEDLDGGVAAAAQWEMTGALLDPRAVAWSSMNEDAYETALDERRDTSGKSPIIRRWKNLFF